MGINVGGTRQLIKAAKDTGIQRLVMTSTHNVCFDHEIVMGDESIPCTTRPTDLHTETKALAEQCVIAADQGPTGLRTIALRPGGIWGGASGDKQSSGGACAKHSAVTHQRQLQSPAGRRPQ